MKKIVIVGCNGQDGQIAFEKLSFSDQEIIGIDIDIIRQYNSEWNITVDITNKEEVFNLVNLVKPNEIYFFAAFHHSSEEYVIDNIDIFLKSFQVNDYSLIYFLEAIKKYSLNTRLFYASSSLIFEATNVELQSELTPACPLSPYGISKLNGMNICRFYREKYDVFASCGIFYNHESKYRSDKFLSKKIIKGAINIKNKKINKIAIGDLNSEVDWGYAPDYVEAAIKILNLDNPDDFIIATGIKHSVKDFVEIVFNYLNLRWQDHIEIDENIIARKRKTLIGNYQKLYDLTGWKPSITFEHMIKIMLIEEE